MKDLLANGYRLLTKWANLLQSPFLLAVRLYWGWQFAQTGWGKLHDLDKVTHFFTTLGIPFPHANAVFVSGLEFAGGLLLIVGLGTRLMGLMLSVDMVVAYIASDREALRALFTDPDKFYNDAAFPFLLASLIVFIFGAGLFSLDHLIQKSTTDEARSNRI